MKNQNVLSIAHKGKASDKLQKLPKPPVYLTDEGKAHYKKWGQLLIKSQMLKTQHLAALEVLANAMGEFEWCLREIKRKNEKHMGYGYVQVFQSGASQVSVEITLKEKAQKTIMQCLKQFGMDPRSEKELANEDNGGQLSLLKEFEKALGTQTS